MAMISSGKEYSDDYGSDHGKPTVAQLAAKIACQRRELRRQSVRIQGLRLAARSSAGHVIHSVEETAQLAAAQVRAHADA